MRKSKRIRHRHHQFPLQIGERISRLDALCRIQEHMSVQQTHPEALRLIELFRIDAEELSEAGVSYEDLKVLEQCAMFF